MGGLLNRAFYDIIVDSDGSGDYTSPAAAFAAEGADKSYLIKGSYTNASTINIPANSVVHFKNVSVAFADNTRYIQTSASIVSGNLSLTGIGNTGDGTIALLGNTGVAIDNSRLVMTITDTSTGIGNYHSMIVAKGINSHFGNVRILSATAFNQSSGQAIYAVQLKSAYSQGFFTVRNFTNAGTDQVFAVLVGNADDGGDYNNIGVFISDITSGGTETGLYTEANANYNNFYGVTNVAGANQFVDNGTGNVSTGLVKI